LRTLEEQLDIAFEHRQGLSCRKIARKLGCNPRTVKKYVEHPELVGKPRKSAPRSSKLDAYREQIAAYLDDDPDYRATLIYERLCRQGYTGGYAIVQRAVRPLRAQKQARAYVRFETEPGAQAQVDFGEFVVELANGTVRRYYLFALILGYSRMLYAELLERCDMPSFLAAHIRAFEGLGGVPAEVLYDRMRNVFVRQLAGKQQFTQSLVELATHYAFTPRVAPAYAPWVKGKVERPMDFIREGFWRGYSFVELTGANRDLRKWLAEKSQRVHGTTHERVDERFAREKPHLQALPAQACDVSERLYREVRKDCTVAVLGNRYVVEHTLVGQQVVVRFSRDPSPHLRVFDGERLVVTYTIPEGKGHLVQDPRFYAALRADKQQAERKFGRSPKGPREGRQGRKGCATLSPSAPAHPLDVRPLMAPPGQAPAVDVQPVTSDLHRVGVGVQHRPLSDYAWLGGEVLEVLGGEVGHA
jgi:transposase